MKRALIPSLWLNVILLIAVAWIHHSRSEAMRLRRESRVSSTAPTSEGNSNFGQSPAPRQIQDSSKGQTAWAMMDSSDPAVLIQHLRAAGCPEKTIQDIVLLRLSRAAYAQVLALAASVDAATPYWRVSWRSGQELQEAVSNLRDALLSELDRLFGDAAPGLRVRMLGLPESYAGEPYLPAGKGAELRRLSRAADREQRGSTQSLGEMPYGWTDAEQESGRRARAESLDGEIRALLSPAEYEEYLVRESPAARLIRSQFPAGASPEEFRRIVMRAHEAGLGYAPPGFSLNAAPPAEGMDDPQAEWRATAKRFRESLTSEFGEDRIAMREREEQARMKSDQEARGPEEFAEIASAAGLSLEEINSFYDTVKGMEAELNQRFKSAISEASTPAEREVVEMEQQAELEGIASDLLGAEKARRLIDALKQRGR